MFRKLISNLPFSPALIHDVGFYAKRLHGEEITRRTTLLFVALALIMQSLAVFSPPESANASSEQDIIRGGVSSLDDFLLRYDRNEDDIKDILTKVGIGRPELSALKPEKIVPNKDTYLLTRYGQLSASANEASLPYDRSGGGAAVRYFSPLDSSRLLESGYDGWTGSSPSVGWFGIMKANGGLVTQGLPDAVSPTNLGTPTAVKTLTAVNLTQDNTVIGNNPNKVQPLDKIAYTLKVTNNNDTSVTTRLSSNLSDALEYSHLIDGGGGTFSGETKELSWPQVQLAPHTSQERTFVVQLLSELPATATGQSNPSSFDCVMTVVFGMRHQASVACPAAKTAELLISQFPAAGIAANVIFASILLVTVLFFYARTRQMRNEIRIIRHNMNAGIM